MAKQRVVLATRNKGKIAELAEPLSAFGYEVIGLDAFPHVKEIEETGSTFAENALIKATAVTKATGLPSIADDSGLSVDALNGQPGIYSARYGDDWPNLPQETRDERNIRKLLHNMKDVPQNKRQCHFTSAMAAVSPKGKELIVEGQWHGQILFSPVGTNGFGYDPVFFDPELGKSAAQLNKIVKNAHSHRGKALCALLAQWDQFIN